MRSSLFLFFSLLCIIPPAATAQEALQFVPNEGQWKEHFLYKSTSPSADIYLEQSGITYTVGDKDNPAKIDQVKEGGVTTPQILKYHAYKMKWIGANTDATTAASKKQSFYNNYYLGKDPGRWKSKVGVYLNVDYKNLYNNVDLHIGSEKGNVKYDFIVYKNGNPDNIQLRFDGLDKMKLEKGNLILYTSVGTVTEIKPFAYQYINGERKEVSCLYKLKDNTVSFYFPDGYNKAEILTIDPTIVFATLTGSTADNWGFTATYDTLGYFYAGGIVGGLGYPTTTGAFQVTFNGGTTGIPGYNELPCDISITKFNPTGNALIYSTYLGGSGDEMPHSIVVDQNNNLIVAGKTFSTNYPVTTSAFDTSANGGIDIFVTKFNSLGTALLASTYIGGSNDDGTNITYGYYGDHNTLRYNYGDASRSEVICDKQGNIYVAASTQSGNFPVTTNAAKSTISGTQDGVFFKLNSNLSSLTYSTYIGGNSNDAAYVLTLDTAQTHVYVAGGTQSSDFFTTYSSGTLYPNYMGGVADGFICRFQNSGSYPLLKATYIGTSDYDQCYGLQIDTENNVYSMGQSMGAFPVTAGVYSNPGSHQFLIKLDSLLSSDIYSTVFGSGATTTPNISPVAFLVDKCENVYISGWGSDLHEFGAPSTGLSTTNLPITSDAFQSTTDGNDFYFIVFSKNALSLLFASYFGSVGKQEHVDGGTSRFDPNGVVYQAICSSCGAGSAFPATPGAWATVDGSTNCNLGAVKIAFNLGSVNAQAQATPDATGCAPLTVNFTNESANATSYEWHFDDGSDVNTQVAPTHTFTEPGVYNVMMIAYNPNACKVRDTAYLTITVSDTVINAGFDVVKTDSCLSFTVAINNTSTPPPGGNISNATFQWDFGDSNTFTGANPPDHTYTDEGTYQIRLIMTYPNACNSPDTVIKTVSFQKNDVAASFATPNACAGSTTAFSNTSTNATSWSWSFGDGSTSNDENPSHNYEPGNYTVTLIAFNPTSCNKADTFSATVNIYPVPTAGFAYTPLQPETNQPTTFINQSQGADHYSWNFGDGTNSIETNPTHQFDITGSFQVCLTAMNQYSCADTICKNVYAEILPLADVPTGFSPNGDGNNDIVFVRGFSIKEMDFKIYNRWGQLVFESTDREKGWDGTFNGKPQPMDAYAYVLTATFKDGTHYKKKGNITLLR